ncbi:nucleoporin NUP49/NSP49 [Colletotrichum lupini]|uniref:Nucleoporin NUP49/NSP49 n=1 Tax=Colletotrichum lupini TaxID=145971 RepID=A0A9Q8WNM0_9PEZI|nr:nucleoporin NUP49/NSP49 [Colletotrichum lupini]UQC90263.1 nucleoporin NUP49/NSP49 [Colletotrichum lupini]
MSQEGRGSGGGTGRGGNGDAGVGDAAFAGCFAFSGLAPGALSSGAPRGPPPRGPRRPPHSKGRPGRHQQQTPQHAPPTVPHRNALVNHQPQTMDLDEPQLDPAVGKKRRRLANERPSHSTTKADEATLAVGAIEAAHGPSAKTAANSSPSNIAKQKPAATNNSTREGHHQLLPFSPNSPNSRTDAPAARKDTLGQPNIGALEQKFKMFGRSAGGLSINTGAANAGTTSNATTSAPSGGGGLFGASTTATTTQPATGGLFGGTSTAGGGLFGNKPSTPQQPATGGLFGAAPAQQPQQQQSSGGLFGGAQTQQPAQQTGGGLFGGAATQQQQPQQQQSGGLFGATPAKPATGGLFGASTAQPQQQQQSTGGGLFGGGNNAQQTQQNQGTGGGLFGQSQAQNQPKPGSLFGQTQPAGSSAPGLTMGQSTTQQSVPGVRVDMSNIKGTTRFNDLEQSIQSEMENCDLMIQRFMAHASEIRGFMAAHGGDLAQLTNDVNWLQRKYEGVKTTLDEDIVTLGHLKDLVKSDADIAKMAFAGADQLKLPAHYHQTWLTRGGSGGNTTNGNQDRNLEDVLTLFSNEADRLKELSQFQVQKIKEMEQHMPGVEHGLYERVRSLRDQTQVPAFNMVLDLLETIKMMGDKIYEAAGSIVDVREKLTQLQRQYPTK